MRLYLGTAATVALLLSGCSQKSSSPYMSPMPTSPTMPKENYSHPTMRPYVINGIKYYPTVVSVGDKEDGIASWYGPNFHGKKTSNGETYNMYDMTAAHKTMPMNTIVRVTNKKNGRAVVVRINDRGPFVASRVIDLSNTAAKEIDMLREGTAPVKLEILGFAAKGTRVIPSAKELDRLPHQVGVEGFAVQIGAFARFEGAQLTQQKYNNTDGYTAIIKDIEVDGNRLFRVWLRGFKGEQEARDFVRRKNFVGSFIVKED